MYDVVIVGGGPAALSAGIYAARYERNTLIITKEVGGQAIVAGEMENYPGFKKTTGFDLIKAMREHTESFENVQIKTDEEVKRVEKVGDTFKITTLGSTYEAKAVLICSGKRSRKLGIDKEDELVGKGLSYCATCDGPFARGKSTLVIGGGYAAVEAALILEKVAESVTIINLNKELSGETITIKKVQDNPKIKVINLANTVEIKQTNGMVSGLVYENIDSKEKTEIEAKIIFVEIGSIPNSEMVSDLAELNDKKEIKVDESQSTKIEGLFAAGDVTDGYFKQIVVAAGDGAKAAISVNHYLHRFR
jgi:alkyl hydroperoxide reductase subunit F